MFTKEQVAALSADLDRKNVRERTQSGRQLSYIEGWWAISEANRIFGYDGWQRETIDLRCVAERERMVGSKNPRQGWGVTYVARVRITVGDLIREGTGSGHGVDVDLGLAHESAVKEAETDAMKRALMTFGNPFGLALYDKDQTHVGTVSEKPSKVNVPTKIDDGLKALGKRLAEMVDMAMTADDLAVWQEENDHAIKRLPEAWQARLREKITARFNQLTEEAA